MKKLTLFLLVINISMGTKAQSAEDSVKVVVNNLFKAMKSSDTGLLISIFADSAVLQTIATNKAGETEVRNESVHEFAETIGKLPAGAADEQIRFEQINIDGALASVWTPYRFYYNGTFSHCGVNSFQLVKINNEWKIQYIIDTRRKKDCK